VKNPQGFYLVSNLVVGFGEEFKIHFETLPPSYLRKYVSKAKFFLETNF